MKKNVEQELMGVIGSMQQQLVSLERKIDVLISRPQAQSQQDNRPQRRFFKVICADCNRECEIPFRPSPGRPVYCKECFSKRRNSANVFEQPFKLKKAKADKGHRGKRKNK